MEEIKKSQTKAARLIATKLIKQFSLKPPINIDEVLTKEYGFTIRKLTLPDNISALVDLDEKEISLNDKKHIHHQRFTLAHELGHFVLNHKVRKWQEYSSNLGSNPDKPFEEEANAFAASFLMPSDFVRHQFKKENKKPQDLAQLCQVSPEAMWYTFQHLRLI